MSRPATARRATTVAPRHPRRVSGPAHRPVPVPAPAPPQQRTTGAIQAVTDHRLLDMLLRSRAWIWILAIGLGGIVTMQVSLLKLNTGISRAVQSAATLERQNAELEVQVARLSSDERIQAAAGKLGMVSQDASAVRFLHARDSDAVRAARRMTPPSAEAEALMQARGLVPPGTLAATTATTAAVPAAPTTVEPAATATPVATPQATPTATPTAAPTAAATGGEVAP